jgi:uncharacterized protein YndB with AHSA1/START domain
VLKIEKTILIHATVDVVWDLLSSQDGMRQWFEPDMEIDLRKGGKHRHVDKETGQLITGEVLELEPKKALTISWFEDGPDTDWINPIRFRFTLEELAEGTLVRFVKEGFEQIGKPTWQRTFEAYERGTERHSLLAKLKVAAESKNAYR